jgi:hypothetical protein
MEERKRLSKRASEREREKRTNQVSRPQIGRSDVASLALSGAVFLHMFYAFSSFCKTT